MHLSKPIRLPLLLVVFQLLQMLPLSFVTAQVAYGQDNPSTKTVPQDTKAKSSKDDKEKEKTKRQADQIIEKLEAKIRKQQEELELLKLFASSLAEIERNYVRKVDRRRLIEAAIDGMLHDLDRYSDYIPAKELGSFQTDIESEYGGIGIRVARLPEEDFLTVTTPIYNSPSYHAGVRAGTWIVKIGDKDATNISVDQAIELIKGEIGSKVAVTFRDKKTDKDSTLQIERAIVQVQTVLGDQRLPSNQWDYLLRKGVNKDEKIGYLRITNFGRQTVKEMVEALTHLKAEEMQGLIIDLRFNPGGLLSVAIDLADLFVDRGLIVRIEGRNSVPRKWVAKKTGTLTGFPIAVLVNGRSASASEIVAACLQDSGRGVIVGQRTFGKGSVQNIVELDKGKSVMKLTTAAYFRPNGQNINRLPEHDEKDEWGVKPNTGYEVEFDDETQRAYFEYRRNRDVIWPAGRMSPPEKEFEDLQLKKAVEYIRKSIASDRQEKKDAKK